MQAGNERPINGTAARVMARGESFEFTENEYISDSCMPLPTREITPEMLLNSSFTDLTGKVFGRFTVIGLSISRDSKWVCRCVCGTYILRKVKGLKDGGAANSPCNQCYRLAVLKKREYFRRTGKQLGTEDFLK